MADFLVEVYRYDDDHVQVAAHPQDFDKFDAKMVFRYSSLTHLYRVQADGAGHAIFHWYNGNDELIWSSEAGFSKDYDPEYRHYLALKEKYEG